MHSFNEKLRDLCVKLYDIGALTFGTFKLKCGIDSPVYFDLRVIVSHPIVMEELSLLLWKFAEYKDIHPVVLCGVPYTALPFTTIISVHANLPMLVRRKEPKNYGTMKLIEGKFSSGDECLVIEDLVTSGSGIMETVNDLRRDGLLVKDAIVVIDRGQGGETNLKNKGIRLHSLVSLQKVLDILCEAGRVDEATCQRVKTYISENQILPDGTPMTKLPRKTRLTLSYANRSNSAKNEMARRLFDLMEKKKSNLCVAVDVSNSEELLKIVGAIGEHVCIIKTHYDTIMDWNSVTETKLQALSKQFDFIIMEDRKFGDIGNTVSLQCESVFKWADIVTMHALAGPEVITGAQEAAVKYGNKGIFIVSEFSSKTSLISPHYTRTTGGLAVTHNDIIVGLVCHTPTVVPHPGLIQLTPEITAKQGVDSVVEQIFTPEDAILVKGADIVVIGKSITQSPDPQLAARSIRDKLWEAYVQRISH